MSRPYRIEYPGVVYHAMARGNNHQSIVLDDEDRNHFLYLLGRCAEKYDLQIYAFCLMDNHYHLFLRTPRPNLHEALQWLGAVFTRRFNYRHGRDGHLFKGRYNAVLVDDQAHWLHLSAYIHLNPVRARLVETPTDWVWSSAFEFCQLRKRFGWLHPELVLSAFGAIDIEQRQRYCRHLIELGGRPPSFWNEIRNSIFLGDSERWEELKAAHPPAGQLNSVADYQKKSDQPVDFLEEIALVAKAFGLTAEQALSGRRGLVRPAAYFHLVRHCGLTGAKVAELFGLSEMAISSGMKRLEERMRSDEKLTILVSELNIKH